MSDRFDKECERRGLTPRQRRWAVKQFETVHQQRARRVEVAISLLAVLIISTESVVACTRFESPVIPLLAMLAVSTVPPTIVLERLQRKWRTIALSRFFECTRIPTDEELLDCSPSRQRLRVVALLFLLPLYLCLWTILRIPHGRRIRRMLGEVGLSHAEHASIQAAAWRALAGAGWRLVTPEIGLMFLTLSIGGLIAVLLIPRIALPLVLSLVAAGFVVCLSAAKAILTRSLSDQFTSLGRPSCPGCGHWLLPSSETGRCPECGCASRTTDTRTGSQN